ncbi:MAG: potassium channel family protein [Stellaceae bacterium]
MIAVAVGLLAFLLLAITAQDAFEVMLLPRRVLRQLRFVSIFYRVTWALWAALTSRFTRGERKEHLLGVYGALSMVLLFSVWIAGLMLGFGLLLWAIEAAVGVTPRPTLGDQLYLSGVTFFTLGYGDLVPHSGLARLLTIFEAGTGLGFIAVVIGYLPVLYQLFSRREAAVIRLDGRAGSPPTAVGLLQRHGGEDGPGQIGIMLREWENWGSELLESHLSYPMLAYYRSQHADQSWLGALTVVIDCCALILVGIGRVPPLQARMTFTMARQILVEMAQSFGIAPSRYEGGDRLDHPTFLRLAHSLADAGFDWETSEAEELLAALRATYEPLLDGLASYLLLPLPGWMPDDAGRDHWERGPRGTLARHLVDELMLTGPAPEHGADDGSRWRRLRSRLRSK